MKTFSEIIILDVGHGNCALVRASDGSVAIVDCAESTVLIQTLRSLGIRQVECVMVSHSDADHINGLTGLLLDDDIHVDKIYVNPDHGKQTKSWEQFRIAIQFLHEHRKKTKIITSLTSSSPGAISIGEITLKVLLPSPQDILGGAGKDLGGAKVDANSLSAVVSIEVEGLSKALLAADMDSVALSKLQEEAPKLKCDLLVFPHHGGLPRTENPSEFAKSLCGYLNPTFIVFSTGRGKFQNPRPEIVAGVIQWKESARLACTQLSELCAQQPLNNISGAGHIIGLGQIKGTACAGSMIFRLERQATIWLNTHDQAHSKFVDVGPINPLCRAHLRASALQKPRTQ